ncbi:MAG: FAD-dependent oxidoreductase [Clostridia bacterium]|nr:FAD-dependent oxidoreductase [Clostridia bacterium]
MRLITLSDVKLPVTSPESELFKLAQKKLGGKVGYFAIKKKSLDARDKNNLRYVYTIEFSKDKKEEEREELERLSKDKTPKDKVLIVGAGPAGLFCALRLLQRGITPIVIERGDPVEKRERRVNAFFADRNLDTESNIQFGEGGAGTFSDGKLNTQTHSPLNREVLKTFVRFGAPEEILWLAKPHIGSDNLKKVVKGMREYILSQGGEVHFRTRLEDIRIENGRVQEVTVKRVNAYMGGGNLSGTTENIPVSALILAIGHSARDTFEKLLARGVTMRAKDFAVGVRIEHLQDKIGLAQYGKNYGLLPPADYKLVSHADERAVFTFCMCPGGYVMPATSEAGGVVTNGMSNYARDGKNANAALIAQVSRADFESDSPLAGIEFQRKIERAAYLAGGKTYAAPVQRMEDFLRDKASNKFGEVEPTYAAGTMLSDMRSVLPAPVIKALKAAALDMDKRLRGFAHPDALLTGVESRTSSPVRIERGEDMQSVSAQGLYPCGEGAGYAGGITSSAADGIRVADAVYAKFATGLHL